MKYSRKTLKNGLNLFLVNIPDARSVVFTIFVKVGSRYERKGEEGVAHFLEHVFFKGSQNYPSPTAITTLIDAIGGDFNAATSKETTEFYIHAEKHHFDLIFDVLTDMVQNPLFSEEELEKEKGVVIEEINLYQDNPGAQVESDLEGVMWPHAALGKEIIGTKKSIEALTRANVFDFKERFYLPNNIILGISGAFDEKHVLRRVQKMWGHLKPGKIPAYSSAKDGQRKPEVLVQHRTTKQAHLALGFKSFPHGHKNNPAVMLLGSILGGNMSSRLFVNIREQKGLAYSVRASNSAYFDTGNFTVHAGLKVEKTLDALRAILAELRRVKTDLVTPVELSRAKDYLKGRVALALEDNQEKLNWVLERFAFTGKIKLPEDLFKALDKVTAKDLHRVANEIFRNEKMSLALIGPFKNRKDFVKEFYLKENY